MKPRSVLVFFGLVAAAFAQQQDVFRVGPVAVRPGERASGMIPVPKGPDGETTVPVTVVRGVKPGPVLALTAGVHGYEYPPILALQEMAPRLDPQHLAGTVIFVHVANMPSFLKRTIYYSPVDGKNLNRVFPGKLDGTLSDRIAYTITKEVIERCDYLIDLHCGDGNESLRPYDYWDIRAANPNVREKARQMVLAFGLDHIVLDRERPQDPADSRYVSTTATTRNKPAITVESGGLGSTDRESIALLESGIQNVMRLLKMIDGEPRMVEHPLFMDPSQVMTTPVTGIFYPVVEKGHTVAKGTLMGYVTDFFGKRIYEMRAPFTGEVLYILGTPPVSAGEPLGMIGKAGEDARP
jgi:predicted deacylase